MKKLTLLCFGTFLFVQSCGKENSDCGCDSKGTLMENVSATVNNLGDYVITLDNAVNKNTIYVVCGGMPDSLKKDNLKIRLTGYFKIFCDNASGDRIGPPITLTSANLKK